MTTTSIRPEGGVQAPGPRRSVPARSPRNLLSAFAGFPRAIWVVFAGTVVNRIGFLVGPFLVFFLGSRGIAASQTPYVLGALGAGNLVGPAVGGWLADRRGRRATMLAGLLGTAAAQGALFAAPNAATMAAAAIALSATATMVPPAASATLADHVGPARRREAFALIGWAVNIGTAVAGILGGYLAAHGYWMLFAIDAGTSVGYAVIVAAMLPAERAVRVAAQGAAGEEASPAGASTGASTASSPSAASAASSPSAASAASSPNAASAASSPSAASAASSPNAASAASSPNAASTTSSPAGSGYGVVLRDRLARRLMALLGVQLFIYSLTESALPLAIRTDGLSPAVMGLAAVVNASLVVALQPLATGALSRFPRTPVYLAGSFLVAAGVALTGVAHSPAAYAATVAVWSIGEVVVGGIPNSLIANLAPAEARGRYQGAFNWTWGAARFLALGAGTTAFTLLGPAFLWWSTLAAAAVSLAGIAALGPAIDRRSLDAS